MKDRYECSFVECDESGVDTDVPSGNEKPLSHEEREGENGSIFSHERKHVYERDHAEDNIHHARPENKLTSVP